MTQAPTPTEDTVRRLVRSLLADDRTGGPDVRPVAAGDPPATWWVGDRHVLRLAPDREAAVRQRRELRLRDLLRPHLPVAVPKSVAHGEWAPGLSYTLDAKVPGGSGEAHAVSAVGEADLAGLLTGLREVPVRQAEALGVPRTGPRPLGKVREAALRAARALAAADEFDPGRLAQLTPAATAQLAVQPGAPVLVHYGLAAEHLVVGADGRVRGVLGWADAAVGDPAEDIAGSRRPSGRPPPSGPRPSPVTAPAPVCAVCGWPAATPSPDSPRPSRAGPRRRCPPCAPGSGTPGSRSCWSA